MNFVLVALGGAIGATLRHALGLLASAVLGSTLPWGTLIVNALGCLAAGALLHAFASVQASDPRRLLLVVGLLGGLTTFSAFAAETLTLLRDGRPLLAITNVAGNVLLSLGAAAVGYSAARWATP